jgi:hypothetical protein
MSLEKCPVCGWPMSVMPQGLVCLNEANHDSEDTT